MNKINALIKPNAIRLLLGVMPFILLILTISCEEEPNSLGAELLPDDDRIVYFYDTSITFEGDIFDKEPVLTSGLTQYPIGIIEDEFLGVFTAKFASEFYPEIFSDSVDMSEISVDSVVLYIDIDTLFGPSENNMQFKAYEISSEINDSADYEYYSDENIDNFFREVDLLSSGSRIQADTLLAIPLINEFAYKFTTQEDSINLSPTYFNKIFKGIAILPDSYSSEGQIIIANTNTGNSKIVIYYHNVLYNDQLTLNYRFTFGSKFGNFINHINAEDVANNCNDSLLFYQAISGVSSKIQFNDYSNVFNPDSLYTILSANLYMPIHKDDLYDVFPRPDNLFLYYSDEDSSLNSIADYNSNYYYRYGKYDENQESYTFNITKHFQDILNEEVTDSCLNISMRAVSPYPYRVMLRKGDNIKLKVTYTKH